MKELLEQCQEYKDMFKGSSQKSVHIRATYHNVMMMIEHNLLEKEKQIIVDAYTEGYEVGVMHDKVTTGEQYYNQTFEK